MAYPACEAVCSPAWTVRCEATQNAEAASEAVRASSRMEIPTDRFGAKRRTM